MSATDMDKDLKGCGPRARVLKVRRMLLPTAVHKAIVVLNRGDDHLPKWNHRLQSLNRLMEWAQNSHGMLELQQHILDSDQFGNLMELERAFRVVVEHIDNGKMDTANLDTRPQAIALQVITWWLGSMKSVISIPGSEQEFTFRPVK